MRGGEFYRLRYTGKPLWTPLQLSAEEDGVVLTFASELDADGLKDLENFEVQTWDLVRSSNYGSERYNTKTLKISNVLLRDDEKTIKIVLPEIKPVDVMTIAYKVKDMQGNEFTGKVQNTIHNLKKTDASSLKKVPLG